MQTGSGWRGGRDSKRVTATPETPAAQADRAIVVAHVPSPQVGATQQSRSQLPARETEPTLAELRAALSDAIRDRAWRVVEIVQAKIDDAERPDNVRVLRR